MTEQPLTSVATGISYGALPDDAHARRAVENALAKMRSNTVGSVLLFLTTGYAHKPQNAIRAAVKAAGTPQVFGSCAVGLLCEQEWLLDAEGAVAMVFPQSIDIRPQKVSAQQGGDSAILLTLSSPNAATIAVNAYATPQFGSISSDDFGHGPFSIWQSGRINENEYTHLSFPNSLNVVHGIAEGVNPLSPTMQINRADRHALLEIEQLPALDNLSQHLPDNLQALGRQQPFNLLCAVSENNHRESIDNGHFQLHHIVSTDQKDKRVLLSGSAKSGRHLFWALRDENFAQGEIERKLIAAKEQLSGDAKFALMFPNIGRGPEFYNGQDRDLMLFNKHFPGVPLIGFYGTGEIAPGHQLAGLIHHYACVFAIFA